MTKELKQQLGIRILNARTKKHLTQDEVADDAGMHRYAISEIERGNRDVRISTLSRIAMALDTTIGKLTKGM